MKDSFMVYRLNLGFFLKKTVPTLRIIRQEIWIIY